MFKKLLIANRGEIACRIIRTAKKLGINCVAIYSEIDKDALHVKLADEAYCIGPAPARESYLNIDKIIEIAKKAEVDAIHPGYGFLSENADFAQACKKNKSIFIGPSPAAIRSMGSKKLAKKIMQKAKVPVIPGYFNAKQHLTAYKNAAEKIGYPVLLKASAGGGGKGMRIVTAASNFYHAWNSAKREALVSFGDDEMILEKYMPEARHVEVQVFADGFQNYVTLFERDCSIQRRNQKIIEEAPAPNLSEELRQKMSDIAIQAARAINYSNAGTIEFLLDKNQKFYFMEMNTRIQVEHPVTEMLTGIDIVEWQIRISAGEKLPLTQEQIKKCGHAFEARIYAEDPENNFLPSTGTITQWQSPIENDTVRIDTGVQEGDLVSIYYDSLLAKLIVAAENRDLSLHKLHQALQQFKIAGVKTNLNFLKKITENKQFKKGEVSTHLINNLSPNDLKKIFVNNDEDEFSPWHEHENWRLNSDFKEINPINVSKTAKQETRFNNALTSPMPGTITALWVKPGQKINKGDNLIAIEAMKMEHLIIAPFSGVIESVFCKHGDIVEEGKELIKIAA